MTACGWCGSSITLALTFSELIRYRQKDERFCQQCKEKLVSLSSHPTCQGCSRIQSGSGLCPDCVKWQEIFKAPVNKHQALYGYNTFAKEVVERFKFAGDCELASLFKEDINFFFHGETKGSVIVPIPLSQTSHASRGFNQTELLLAAAGVEYSPILENKSQTEKQSKKSRVERLKTPQPFAVKEDGQAVIQGADIILADDIYTTGRTVYHAVELVKRYEPASVKSFSLFR